jgi:hypothetical protein
MLAFPERRTEHVSGQAILEAARCAGYHVDPRPFSEPIEVLRHSVDLIVVPSKGEAHPLIDETGRPRFVALNENAALDEHVQCA